MPACYPATLKRGAKVMLNDSLVSYFDDPATGRPLAYMIDPLRRTPTAAFTTGTPPRRK